MVEVEAIDMKIGGHWSVFHVNQMNRQLRQKALNDQSEEEAYARGKSYAKGQMITVGVILGIAILLLIVLHFL
jgi:hypothetical protein